MAKFRYSVRRLLAVVTILCLCLAAIVKPTLVSTSIAIAVTRIILCASVVFAVMLPGRKRAFWFGFALAGWSDFLSLLPFFLTNELEGFGQFGIHNAVLSFRSFWEDIHTAESSYAAYIMIKTLFSLVSALVAGYFCRWIYDQQIQLESKNDESGNC